MSFAKRCGVVWAWEPGFDRPGDEGEGEREGFVEDVGVDASKFILCGFDCRGGTGVGDWYSEQWSMSIVSPSFSAGIQLLGRYPHGNDTVSEPT